MSGITGTIVIDLTVGDKQWIERVAESQVWLVAEAEPAGVPVKLLVGDKWPPVPEDFVGNKIGAVSDGWVRLVAKHPIVVEGHSGVGAWVRFLRSLEAAA